MTVKACVEMKNCSLSLLSLFSSLSYHLFFPEFSPLLFTSYLRPLFIDSLMTSPSFIHVSIVVLSFIPSAPSHSPPSPPILSSLLTGTRPSYVHCGDKFTTVTCYTPSPNRTHTNIRTDQKESIEFGNKSGNKKQSSPGINNDENMPECESVKRSVDHFTESGHHSKMDDLLKKYLEGDDGDDDDKDDGLKDSEECSVENVSQRDVGNVLLSLVARISQLHIENLDPSHSGRTDICDVNSYNVRTCDENSLDILFDPQAAIATLGLTVPYGLECTHATFVNLASVIEKECSLFCTDLECSLEQSESSLGIGRGTESAAENVSGTGSATVNESVSVSLGVGMSVVESEGKSEGVGESKDGDKGGGVGVGSKEELKTQSSKIHRSGSGSSSSSSSLSLQGNMTVTGSNSVRKFNNIVQDSLSLCPSPIPDRTLRGMRRAASNTIELNIKNDLSVTGKSPFSPVYCSTPSSPPSSASNTAFSQNPVLREITRTQIPEKVPGPKTIPKSNPITQKILFESFGPLINTLTILECNLIVLSHQTLLVEKIRRDSVRFPVKERTLQGSSSSTSLDIDVHIRSRAHRTDWVETPGALGSKSQGKTLYCECCTTCMQHLMRCNFNK